MPRHKTYTQCKLRKGNLTMVSWIPSDLAKKGLVVNLKDDLGVWKEGWTVEQTWKTKKGETVEAAVPDFRHQREVSDV
jgi:hypothetical protein